MVNRLSSSVVQLRRCYWTATTFRSSSPHKLVEAIQQNIQAFQPNPSTTILDPPSVLLFTISKRIPSEPLESLVRSFQNLVPAIEPIGCLTQDSSIHLYSASIAKWSGPSADLVPFTSTIPSRPCISVGREILPSDQGADSRGDYTGHAHHVGAESTVANQLPEELRRIPPNSIGSLIFFSAPSPQPFLKLLQRTFPSAILMGLLGSSTAFETGRTSTLFRGRSILGDHGAVGIAVLKPSTTSTASPIVRYTNMRTLGNPMRVTRSQGNIILTLDSKKATSYLLEVIMKSDDINESARSSELIISKEKEFFLGFLNEQHLVVEICRIIGGSTSRGTMALDREKEIKVNQLVQFIHSSWRAGGTGIESAQEQTPEPSPTMSPGSTETIELEFSCSDRPSFGPEGLGSDDDIGKVEAMNGVFCGASEAGFVPSHQTIVNLAHCLAQYKL